jgi:IS1 family transposase
MVNMNRLSIERRAQVIAALVEGNSIRSTVRMTGAAKNTVVKLLLDLGEACSEYQDGAFRNLTCKRVQIDEIWAFVGAKQKNIKAHHPQEWGDAWTWVALDADSKLVPSWLVGPRNTSSAVTLLRDLGSRVSHRIQLTTDGWRPYVVAVADTFGDEIDYATLHKLYGNEPTAPERRYTPAKCIGVDVHHVSGDPDPAHISTSYIERQNLTMRMSLRRMTRLTNAFSRKVENLAAAVSLHFAYYNLARPHKTLSKRYPTTPAMAAGVADHVWMVREIAELLD